MECSRRNLKLHCYSPEDFIQCQVWTGKERSLCLAPRSRLCCLSTKLTSWPVYSWAHLGSRSSLLTIKAVCLLLTWNLFTCNFLCPHRPELLSCSNMWQLPRSLSLQYSRVNVSSSLQIWIPPASHNVDILDWIILLGGCPVHHMMFSHITCFFPLHTSGTPQLWQFRSISRHYQMFPRGQNHPQLRTTVQEFGSSPSWLLQPHGTPHLRSFHILSFLSPLACQHPCGLCLWNDLDPLGAGPAFTWHKLDLLRSWETKIKLPIFLSVSFSGKGRHHQDWKVAGTSLLESLF